MAITTDSRRSPTVSDSRIAVENLSYRYKTRRALSEVSFDVARGEIFGILGPNGSGKTTLFRILSTLMPATAGTVRILGYDLATDLKAVRNLLGVVFQHPGVGCQTDCHRKFATSRASLRTRRQNAPLPNLGALERFGVSDRATERVEVLSGGLQRRVEIAKAMLHSPRVLLLDEPTSGLDVTARRQLNDYLRTLAETENILVLLTTHLLADAEACNRVGILDVGRLVDLGTPNELKAKVGGDVIRIETENSETLGTAIAEQFGVSIVRTDNQLRVACEHGHEFVRDVVAAFPEDIQAVRFGKPTLEDVFIELTGNPFV